MTTALHYGLCNTCGGIVSSSTFFYPLHTTLEEIFSRKKCRENPFLLWGHDVCPPPEQQGSQYLWCFLFHFGRQEAQSKKMVTQLVKNLPAMRDTWIQSLGWEDPLEKGTSTHSRILAWRIPWDCTVPWVAKSRTRLSDFHFPSRWLPIFTLIFSLVSTFHFLSSHITFIDWQLITTGRWVKYSKSPPYESSSCKLSKMWMCIWFQQRTRPCAISVRGERRCSSPSVYQGWWPFSSTISRLLCLLHSATLLAHSLNTSPCVPAVVLDYCTFKVTVRLETIYLLFVIF